MEKKGKKLERKKEYREKEREMIFPTTNTTTSGPRVVTESGTTSGSGEGTSGEVGGSDYEPGSQGRMKPSTPAMMIQERVSSSGIMIGSSSGITVGSSSGIMIGSSTGHRSSCPSSINHSLSSSPITTSGLATSGHLPGSLGGHLPGSLGDHHGSKLAGILSTSPSHNYNTIPSRTEIGHHDSHVRHDGHEDQCMVSPVDDSNYLNDNIDPVSILNTSLARALNLSLSPFTSLSCFHFFNLSIFSLIPFSCLSSNQSRQFHFLHSLSPSWFSSNFFSVFSSLFSLSLLFFSFSI